jgi:hypothetical protein
MATKQAWLHISSINFRSSAGQRVTSERGLCGGPWLVMRQPRHVSHLAIIGVFLLTLSTRQYQLSVPQPALRGDPCKEPARLMGLMHPSLVQHTIIDC